jgi:tetratricopeptide (TPR) repeat protein
MTDDAKFTLQSFKTECQTMLECREDIYTDDGLELASLIEKAREAIHRLDATEWETKGILSERGQALCLRGQLLDISPTYEAEAEKALIKAIKFSPSLVEAWNTLGCCYWKKNDLASAKNCFTCALGKQKNVTSLQQLSMLNRGLARTSLKEAAQLVEESVQHAKDAISMDVANCKSWYCLGNAYLNLYFHKSVSEPGTLRSALKSYHNAERGDVTSKNPDLHFNRAMVYRYLEEHHAALEGFSLAGQIDASLPWSEEVESLVALTSRLHELVLGKAFLKPKKLQLLVTSVNASEAPAKLKVVGVTDLVAGKNAGVCVQCRLVQGISKGNVVPLHFVVVDSFGNCFALSVLGMAEKGIKENSTLTVLEPILKETKFTWKQKAIEYLCLRVEGPTQILVSGLHPMGFQVAPTLQTTTIS